ncbi:hypothetical protein J4448_00490 [Candidatus Woesearchaeota archaeon]|nr:hypothetical protein [Candidatus Woesearchaeota archaeon]
MSDLFKVKLRKIGTSAGLLVPKGVMEEEKLKVGEEVEVVLFKKKKLEDIEKMFGTAKGAKPFVRDRTDRVERW